MPVTLVLIPNVSPDLPGQVLQASETSPTLACNSKIIFYGCHDLERGWEALVSTLRQLKTQL